MVERLADITCNEGQVIVAGADFESVNNPRLIHTTSQFAQDEYCRIYCINGCRVQSLGVSQVAAELGNNVNNAATIVFDQLKKKRE